MVTLRQAAQQALEHVQEFKRRWWQVPAFGNKVNKATIEAITNAHSTIFELEHALRNALAEQPAEPVAWANPNDLQNFDMKVRTSGDPLHTVPLYTAPQPLREVELKDEEIQACGRDLFWPLDEDAPRFARAVIEAYKAKQEKT